MKRGISLIVLVITIIVMVILAGAIILTLNNNGIISKASGAVEKTDYKNVATAAQLVYAQYLLGQDIGDLSVGEWIRARLIENGTITEKQAALYKFNHDGTVELIVEEKYDYPLMDAAYYTVSDKGEFNLTDAGKAAAKDGTLTEIVVPYGATSIKYSAVKDCISITKVIMPNTVTTIGSGAFSGCTSLNEIVMSKNLESISGGKSAFSNTPWLSNEESNSTNGLLISNGVLIDGSSAAGNVIIPNSVKIINEYAFKNNKNITDVSMPATVTNIGNYAFRECTSLKSVQCPENLTSMGILSFYKCTALENINFPESLTYIGYNAFIDCSSLAIDLIIPSGITEIGDATFSGCSKIKSVEWSDNLKVIGGGAFKGCNKITSVNLKNVVEIDHQAFMSCTSLSTIEGANSLEIVRADSFKSTAWLTAQRNTTTDGLVTLGKCLVDGSKATGKVVIPEGIVSIASYAFYNNDNITEVELPTTLLRIEHGSGSGIGTYDGAFYSCGGITTITIPSNVVLIGAGTFKNCSKLKTINFLGEIPVCGRSAFYGTGITGDIKTKIIEKNSVAFEGSIYF